MRNWNTILPHLPLSITFVLSLPMRNWNMNLVDGNPDYWMCFESTYEELKLGYGGLPLGICQRVLSLPMRNWNFEYYLNELNRCHVLSLPMRNWNIYNCITSGPSTPSFWVYLWGIETIFVIQRVFVVWLVLSLPMRNWNFSTVPAKEYLGKVLSLPMRNWNSCQAEKSSFIFTSFWVYLWGIETCNSFQWCARLSLFWVYLWGIETILVRFKSTVTSCVLSLPMRNWNSILVLLTSASRWFWVYLWGIETFQFLLEIGQKLLFWVYLWGIETPFYSYWRLQEQ